MEGHGQSSLVLHWFEFFYSSFQYTLLHELNGHVGFINVLQFDPSGKSFFSGGNDGIVRQWHSNADKPAEERSWSQISRSPAQNAAMHMTITDLQLSPKTKQLIVIFQHGEVAFLDQTG